MGFRTFTDRGGRVWEVRDRSSREWEFSPGKDNPGPSRVVAAPGYEKDPFELSLEELQRLLDAATVSIKRERKSPFLD
ncbi:MAG: hypothetical protein HYT81_05685 [Gemmatimonadetes bacterium]|nr:hypothetical protein [Gemmatimonadota bacterium]MBI2404092.1 hypothetical protein [Gemmatimonadota bacterium]